MQFSFVKDILVQEQEVFLSQLTGGSAGAGEVCLSDSAEHVAMMFSERFLDGFS